jgi:hypothetical protein
VGTGSSGAFRTLSSTVNPADDLFNVVSKLKAATAPARCWVMNKKTPVRHHGVQGLPGPLRLQPGRGARHERHHPRLPGGRGRRHADYTTASALAVAFGNFKRGYIIVDRVGTRVIRDPFSNKPYVGFYTTKRLGGAVLNSECHQVHQDGLTATERRKRA